MFSFEFTGNRDEIMAYLEGYSPGVGARIQEIYPNLEHYPKREIRDYEAALLYVMAEQYNHDGALIFEIGTCWGWSAAVMAEAAPLAKIVTCTPNPSHIQIARRNLERYNGRVTVVGERSQDYLEMYDGGEFDMIFVDGDHKAIVEDLPWYNYLKTGGLMLHHDYCPADAPVRPCRWVWQTLNEFEAVTHKKDVLIADPHNEGMAGWYRQEGEIWT